VTECQLVRDALVTLAVSGNDRHHVTDVLPTPFVVRGEHFRSPSRGFI